MRTYEFEIQRNGEEVRVVNYVQDDGKFKGNTPIGREAKGILRNQKDLTLFLKADKLRVVLELE